MNATKFYLDTEFIEAGRHAPVQFISIGIVSEDGREFYAESQEFDPKTVSPWLKENVLPHLGPVENRKPVALIAKEVREFVGNVKPEFWGYYADYDWVVFCQMFGSMIDLPEGWPMYCRDIKQLCDSLGNPKLPENKGAEHNALSDAKWNETALQFLLSEHSIAAGVDQVNQDHELFRRTGEHEEHDPPSPAPPALSVAQRLWTVEQDVDGDWWLAANGRSFAWCDTQANGKQITDLHNASVAQRETEDKDLG